MKIELNTLTKTFTVFHAMSLLRTWQIFSGPCQDLVNSQSMRRHCLALQLEIIFNKLTA